MNAVGIIFSNIYDKNLSEITKNRTVASLPFAARYRQVDFILSNMSNSGVEKIGIITKYNYQSLVDHLGSCQEWDLNTKNRELKIIAPFALESNKIYHGKLDALANAFDFLKYCSQEYVILGDTTTICAIDFEEILNNHIASGADITAVVTKFKSENEQYFPLTVDFDDNQKAAKVSANVYSDDCFAGMGIYIMKREKLLDTVKDCVSKGYYHFERDFILRCFNAGNLSINTYVFKSPVLFNTSTLDYFRNSMALLKRDIFTGIFCRKGFTIYTKVRDSVPVFYGPASNIKNCLVADGCKLHGTAEDSILFRDVTIAESASVKDCIIMQGCTISEGAVLEGMILDKEVVIKPNTILKGSKDHPIVIEKRAVI